jgi:carbon-monoxide dehydrogenase medium subunit
MRWSGYLIMKGLDETLECLLRHEGRARVVAGGTDFVVQAVEGEVDWGDLLLLDISQLDEIRGIEVSGSFILIGAATTMAELASDHLISRHARALAQGARWLGSPQIRNMATIGGNVVNAQPAADASIPLIALNATARIASPWGVRELPVEELFLDVGKSRVDPTRELITHFIVPISDPRLSSSSMQRLSRRKAFALPQLVVAVRISLEKTRSRFREVAIAAGPVAPVPWRAREAEQILKDAPIRPDLIEKAAQVARLGAKPRDSLRGSATYRRDMVEVMVKRALLDALSQLNAEPK